MPSHYKGYPLVRAQYCVTEIQYYSWGYLHLSVEVCGGTVTFFVCPVCLISFGLDKNPIGSGLMKDHGTVKHCSGRQGAFLVLPTFVRSGPTQPAVTMGLCGHLNVLFSDCCGSLGAHNGLI